MSTSSPEAAGPLRPADLIAEAILDEVRSLAGPRRLYMGQVFGVSISEILEALLRRASPETTWKIEIKGGKTFTLKAIAIGETESGPRLLVPYMSGKRGTNSGAQGFSGNLRDAAAAEEDSAQVLLILDDKPDETIITACEDASRLFELSWQKLSERACTPACPAVAEVLTAVRQDDEQGNRLPRTRASLEVLADLAMLNEPDEVGRDLHRLGSYLCDPEVAVNPLRRLRRAAEERLALDRMTSPGLDLLQELASRYGQSGNAGIERVIDAVTPFGLDYAKFALDDLGPPRRLSRAFRIAFPLAVNGGAAIAALGGRAAIWVRGGGQFGLKLSAPATEHAVATISWSDGSDEELEIVSGDREILIQTEGIGWRFAAVQLGDQRAELAILLDEGQWAPYESSLDLDLSASAFRCKGEPHVLAMNASSELVQPPNIFRAPDDTEDGEPEDCIAELSGEKHSIRFLIESSIDTEVDDDDGDGAGADGEAGGDPDDDDEGRDPEGSGDGGQPTEGRKKPPVVASVPHARLSAKRQGQEIGQSSFRVSLHDDRGWIGNILSPVAELKPQTLYRNVDGLDLERQILANPSVTAFSLADGGELERYAYLDELALDGLPADAVADFMSARTALFARLTPAGSAHAVGAGIGLAEAAEYVAAYCRLVEGLLIDQRFAAEYERILLMDAVSVPESGELLLAPTNPLNLAFLIELSNHVESWLDRAKDLHDDDVESLSTRHLVPYFSLGAGAGKSFETGAEAPLLWRRYRPTAQATPGEYRSKHISKTIKHFLSVHPEYQDERQRLALAFYEPGAGTAVLESLREWMRPLLNSDALSRVPQLDIWLIAETPTRTWLDAISVGEAGPDSNSSRYFETDRVLRERMRVFHRSSAEKPSFVHLAFVFESALDAAPATVALDARAGTLFVDGLATAPGRQVQTGQNEKTFLWGTFCDPRQTGVLADLNSKLLQLVSGMPRNLILPGHTRMPSVSIQSVFLDDLYLSSVWVVHLDKLLGLEAFAPNARGQQARYLIDYEGGVDSAQPGLDAITGTARIEPYKLALTQALMEDVGKPTESGLDRLLQIFNGVSGRWALDLVGANPNQLHERIGLAIAISAVMDLDCGFDTESGTSVGVVLPMDEVLDAVPRQPDKDNFCDDLLYVRLTLGEERPVLHCRLLEVKYRKSTDSETLETVRKQLTRAHAWLLSTFGDIVSPQHLFRARDLAQLLREAATRSAAFNLLELTAETRIDFEKSLNSVAAGEFDLHLDYREGTDTLFGDFVSIEPENSVEVHRQRLNGEGLSFGHLRLGRPAIEALAGGKALVRPVGLPFLHFNGDVLPDAQDDAGEQEAGEQEAGEQEAGEQPVPTAGPTVAEEDSSAPPGRINFAPPSDLAVIGGRLDSVFRKYKLTVEPFVPGLAQVGPSVIRFRTRTQGTLSITEVERRSRDIGREIAAPGAVRIGDEPGFVSVDVPRESCETVHLDDVLPILDRDSGRPGALQFVVGVAPSGDVRVADLSRLPHLLVAGATDSGKSVFLKGMLLELLRARTPEQLQMLIVDPKRLDFGVFANDAHLIGRSVISNPNEALATLNEILSSEIARRQPIIERAHVSSATEFYEAGGTMEELPALVILIDEFADLVLAADDRRAFHEIVQRYVQLTRAYGIFLVLAIQRPTVELLTGSIKTNLSARIAFSLPTRQDSMTVIDRPGAENLLGHGDMLFYVRSKVERLQAPFTSREDIRRILGG